MDFFTALLKINVTLAVGYLAYLLLFRRLTFYQANRFLLFGVMLLALAMPFIQFQWGTRIIEMQETLLLPQARIVNAAPAPSKVDYLYWLQIVALAGTGILLGRILVQLASLAVLKSRSRRSRVDETMVWITQKPTAPFSFFMMIFAHPAMHSSSEWRTVLLHEKTHATQLHSVDVLLAEVVRAVCWYNPLAWLLLRGVKENLEFIADESVIANGADVSAYQYSLLHLSNSAPVRSLANSFSFSHLKTRITMMNKTRSGRSNKLRYLAILPAATALVFGFGKTEAQKMIVVKKDSTASQQKVVDTLQIVSKEGKKVWPAVKVTVRDDDSTLRDDLMYLFDGKKISKEDLTSISPADIESVTVHTKKESLAEFGAEGRDGVVVIKKKKAGENSFKKTDALVADDDAGKPQIVARNVTLQEKSQDRVMMVPNAENLQMKNPLSIGDGKKVLVLVNDKKSTIDAVNSLPSNDIDSITILKDKHAAPYGEEGKDGVILIKLKEKK